MQKISRIANGLNGMAKTALDAVLPPRCIATGQIVDAQGMVAPAFWRELNFIDDPMCATCGHPFDYDTGPDAVCAACIAREPDFDRARSALSYDDVSRKLVLNFKYGDQLHAAAAFVPWLKRAGAAFLREDALLVPVPLHRRRLWQRRYNQSALLAQALSAQTGIACQSDLLVRTRHTPPQKGMNARERRKNVRRAFALRDRCAGMAEGRAVVLIDDVFTSGATLNECAKILKKAGAESVCALTLARVSDRAARL